MGVVGESGCGKSTLGRVLVHLEESTDGRFFFEDKDVTKLRWRGLKQYRENAQIIFQDPYSSLNPRYSVEETIQETYQYSTSSNSGQITQKAGIDKHNSSKFFRIGALTLSIAFVAVGGSLFYKSTIHTEGERNQATDPILDTENVKVFP